MLRGHIWTSRANPAAPQKDAILAAGVTRALYTDDFESAFKSLRAKDTLVVKGYRGCGRSEAEIRKNIARIHAKGAVVLDVETGKLSTGKQREVLIAAAIKALANE